MSIEIRVSPGADSLTLTDLRRNGARLFRGLILTVVIAGWVFFWGLVARLHVQLGNLLSAAIVSILFVLPAIIGFGYLLTRKLSIINSEPGESGN